MATATTIPLPPYSPTSRITGTAGQTPCYHQGLGPNASALPASPPPPARSILNHSDSGRVPFFWTVNP
jgi:hypothetical protein